MQVLECFRFSCSVNSVCIVHLQLLLLLSTFVMVAICNRADHYIFACDYYLSIYLSIFLFFSSLNLSIQRVDVYHTSTHGVALVQI